MYTATHLRYVDTFTAQWLPVNPYAIVSDDSGPDSLDGFSFPPGSVGSFPFSRLERTTASYESHPQLPGNFLPGHPGIMSESNVFRHPQRFPFRIPSPHNMYSDSRQITEQSGDETNRGTNAEQSRDVTDLLTNAEQGEDESDLGTDAEQSEDESDPGTDAEQGEDETDPRTDAEQSEDETDLRTDAEQGEDETDPRTDAEQGDDETDPGTNAEQSEDDSLGGFSFSSYRIGSFPFSRLERTTASYESHPQLPGNFLPGHPGIMSESNVFRHPQRFPFPMPSPHNMYSDSRQITEQSGDETNRGTNAEQSRDETDLRTNAEQGEDETDSEIDGNNEEFEEDQRSVETDDAKQPRGAERLTYLQGAETIDPHMTTPLGIGPRPSHVAAPLGIGPRHPYMATPSFVGPRHPHMAAPPDFGPRHPQTAAQLGVTQSTEPLGARLRQPHITECESVEQRVDPFGLAVSRRTCPSREVKSPLPTKRAKLSKSEAEGSTGKTSGNSTTNQPKHPEFSQESLRLSTFRTWGVQSPESLCKAGFYYTGERDIVRCFHCDGVLRNWDHDHDPFIEHERRYPECDYIQNVKNRGAQLSIRDHHSGAVVPTSRTGDDRSTLPGNAGEILKSLIKDNKEMQRKTHENGMKLQALIDATNSTPSDPIPEISVPYLAFQRSMTAQRQLDWNRSSPGLNFGMVARARMMTTATTTAAAPTLNIQRADEGVTKHQKILLKIASVITSPDELNMLGIWLGCDHNDIRRLKNSNPNLKDAAYEVLCSFYDSVPNTQRWSILIDALKELNKHATVKELRLEDLQQQAQE